MKKYIILAGILLMINACTTIVSKDYFSMISNKKNLKNFEIESHDIKDLKTKYCDYVFLFFPLGVKTKNMSDVAISEMAKYNLKNNTHHDTIINVDITRKFTMFFIIDSNCVYIDGQITNLKNK
jgi:gamma-glutamyl phosphate reductase